MGKYLREAIDAEAEWRWWHDEQAAKESPAYVDESVKAADYTRQWHVTYEWAFEILKWDSPADWHELNPRVTRVRAAIVRDAENEEEAYRRAIPVELIEDWLAVDPPRRGETGRRRVVIRLYTWVIDRDNEVAYDPEWLKIADDMSPMAAVARARRWAQGYADSLVAETASREIKMTQIEILFWTQGEKERRA